MVMFPVVLEKEGSVAEHSSLMITLCTIIQITLCIIHTSLFVVTYFVTDELYKQLYD